MITRSSFYTSAFTLFGIGEMKNFKLHVFKTEYLRFYYLSSYDVLPVQNIKIFKY